MTLQTNTMTDSNDNKRFDVKACVGHIAIALVVGAFIAHFTDAKLLAAAFWVSAPMYFNRSLAIYENPTFNGHNKPLSTEIPSFTKNSGAAKYWVSRFAMTVALMAAGFACQTYL